MHLEYTRDLKKEISNFLNAKTEWDASDAAYRFTSMLQQTFHPFLWNLLESDHLEVVMIAANALAVSMRGEGNQDTVDRIMKEVNRVDPDCHALPVEERNYLKMMLIDGLTMAQILSQKNNRKV